MARVGMKWPLWAPLQQEVIGQMPVYGNGILVGGAVSGNIAFTRNNAEQYADDVLKENDNSVTGGTVSLDVDKINSEAMTTMLGFVKNEDDNSMDMTDRASPWGGYGYIRVESVNNKIKYSALWCYKVMLGQSNIADNTKTQSTSYSTNPLEGKLSGVVPAADMTTRFYRYSEFDTLEEAWTWLKTIANYTGEHP